MVFDCFCGSGTTLLAAHELKRNWVGIDNSEVAIQTTTKRLTPEQGLFNVGPDYEYIEQKAIKGTDVKVVPV